MYILKGTIIPGRSNSTLVVHFRRLFPEWICVEYKYVKVTDLYIGESSDFFYPEYGHLLVKLWLATVKTTYFRKSE